MQQEKQRAKAGNARRAVTAVVVAAGMLATAGSATAAAGAARPVEPGPSPVMVEGGKKPGFYETYHGHHIMGWGADESACAYIDGRRLVVYPAGDGSYTSALQGFKKEPSLRAITKASAKVLGDLDMSATTEPAAHCPEFEIIPKPEVPQAGAPKVEVPKPEAPQPKK